MTDIDRIPAGALVRFAVGRNCIVMLGVFLMLALWLTSRPVLGLSEGNAWSRPGIVRIAGRDVSNLNPLFANDDTSIEIAHFWGGYLLDIDDKGNLVPSLAMHVPTIANGGISADGKTIRYVLRRGVRWQDGIPLTAGDVAFTWRAIVSAANAVPNRAPYDRVQSIKVQDSEVVVHLRTPFAPFVSSFFVTRYCILPEHAFKRTTNLGHDDYNVKPLGSGPFIVTEFQRGVRVKLVANKGYWRGTPALNEVDWNIVPDTNAGMTAILAHEADIRTALGPAQAEALRVPGYRIASSRQNAPFMARFNLASPLLSDQRIRRALTMATDIPAMIRDVSHNQYSGSPSAIEPGSWAFDRTVPPYASNSPAARKLLESAGWRVGPDGVREKNGRPLELTMVSIASPLANQVKVLLQDQWSRVGVRVSIRDYDVATLYGPLSSGGIFASGKYDVGIDAEILGPDPDDSEYMLCSAVPPRGRNVGRYCNPAVDAAEAQATASYDPKVRARAYSRLQHMTHDDIPFIVLWFVNTLDAVNTDLQNYRPASGGQPNWNAWQWRI